MLKQIGFLMIHSKIIISNNHLEMWWKSRNLFIIFQISDCPEISEIEFNSLITFCRLTRECSFKEEMKPNQNVWTRKVCVLLSRTFRETRRQSLEQETAFVATTDQTGLRVWYGKCAFKYFQAQIIIYENKKK